MELIEGELRWMREWLIVFAAIASAFALGFSQLQPSAVVYNRGVRKQMSGVFDQRVEPGEERLQQERRSKEIMEKMFNRHPVMAFSVNTHFQVAALHELGNEVLGLIEQGKRGDRSLDGPKVMRAHNLFWFWLLGAYEVLRTMDQHKTCFLETVAIEINDLKKKLAAVRVPFAKQELRGTPKSISDGELSIYGFGNNLDTLLYKIGEETYDAVALIRNVIHFLNRINRGQRYKGNPPRRS